MKNIEDTIETFDFDKVHKVMVYLDWKWMVNSTGAMQIPTVEQMKRCVGELANYAHNSLLKDNRESSYAATGGFKVTASKVENDIDYVIEFILEESL